MIDTLKSAIAEIRESLSQFPNLDVELTAERAKTLADAAELLSCPECGGTGYWYRYEGCPKGCDRKRRELGL